MRQIPKEQAESLRPTFRSKQQSRQNDSRANSN
jgi:hypothetical protein